MAISRICHGATGDGRGVFGTSSYPNATDLTTRDAAEKSDGQLFWIIKNGLSFTGMPGFSDQYPDQDIWSLVTYISALQTRPGAPAPPPAATPAAPALPSAARPGGGGRNGPQVQFGPIEVPTPSTDQLDRADPTSSDPGARGAAIYFAQGARAATAPSATRQPISDWVVVAGLTRREPSAPVDPACPPTTRRSSVTPSSRICRPTWLRSALRGAATLPQAKALSDRQQSGGCSRLLAGKRCWPRSDWRTLDHALCARRGEGVDEPGTFEAASVRD